MKHPQNLSRRATGARASFPLPRCRRCNQRPVFGPFLMAGHLSRAPLTSPSRVHELLVSSYPFPKPTSGPRSRSQKDSSSYTIMNQATEKKARGKCRALGLSASRLRMFTTAVSNLDAGRLGNPTRGCWNATCFETFWKEKQMRLLGSTWYKVVQLRGHHVFGMK